jgi:RHS repeat-associated protein
LSVTTLTWDAADQLIQIATPSVTETYQYDHAGRRISKTSNGTTTHYRYNGEDIDAEYTATWTETARYVHGPGTDDPLMRLTGQTNDPAATAIYYHQDGINSVVATSNQAGAIAGAQLFDAWGNKTASSGTVNQYGFTGREPDATGLVYYRARYYDPSIGRFISRDPAGMVDGVNRYAYVGNSPTNFVDPSGEDFVTAGYGAFAGLVGGVITGSAQDGLRGAVIGGLTGAVAGGVVGFFTPQYSNRAGSLAAGAVTGAVANLVQQNLTNGTYTQMGLPQQVKQVSYLQAAGSGLGTAGGQLLRIAGPAAGRAVGNAIVSLIAPTTRTAATVVSRTAATTGSKIAGALYEGGTSAYGELAADQMFPQPVPVSLPNSTVTYSTEYATGNPSAANSYFSNMQGTGGSANQSLFGASPRN